MLDCCFIKRNTNYWIPPAEFVLPGLTQALEFPYYILQENKSCHKNKKQSMMIIVNRTLVLYININNITQASEGNKNNPLSKMERKKEINQICEMIN